MSQFALKDRALIDAATNDIDTRQVAKEARTELAERYGANGFKVIMAGQDTPGGTEVQAVTLLRFGKEAPNGFVSVGQDKDGQVLALPDMRTFKGEDVAKEMSELPAYSNSLSQAMGFGPKIENGKVSYGIINAEEIGREVVVKTNRTPEKGLDVEALSVDDYASLKQSVSRAKKMMSEGAPSPYAS